MKRLAADGERCASTIVACRNSIATLDGHAIAGLVPDEASGYSVQRLVGIQLGQDGLGSVAGYKLGMTSPALQARFGLIEPLYGPIYAGGRIEPGGSGPASKGARPLGVECEIAVTLSIDLPDRGVPHDSMSVAAAIGTFHTAIEIIENRFVTLDRLSPWVIVADGVLHRAFVLGAGLREPPEIRRLAGELWLGETRLSRGAAGELFGGGPVEALAWLANKLTAQGDHLRSGDIVLSGSLGPAAWLPTTASGEVVAQISGLGSAAFHLA